jgi:Uma2 family endonuclease
MYARSWLAEVDNTPTQDSVVAFRGMTWADYERFLEARGDKSAPRLTYLEGTLELMSPSYDHEILKSMIARLLEAYCMEREIDFTPLGSWTLKDKKKERGAEPDECYVLGVKRKSRPDLAIEIEWTWGRLDKLEVYRKLGVGEVWYWRRGKIEVYRLRGERYRKAARSALFPDLDLDLMLSFLDRPSTTRAVRDFRAALAKPRHG